MQGIIGRMTHPAALRLLLGALLFAGLNLLPWAAPAGQPALNWLAQLAGAWILAALMLDIAARFRLRDGFGVLALAGLTAITAALTFDHGYALANPPLTWFTRVLGLLTLGALGAWLSLLRLARPMSARGAALTLLLAGAFGALWGYWARWSPLAIEANAAPTPAESIVFAGVIAALPILLALALAARLRSGEADDLRLKPILLALLWLGTLALLVGRVLSGAVDAVSALALPMLGLVCVGVLYYQKRERGVTLLDALPGLPPPTWARLLIPLAVIALAGAFIGAQLPQGDPGSGPLLVLSAALTAFGVLWLPGVALVIAARAFSRLARTDRL